MMQCPDIITNKKQTKTEVVSFAFFPRLQSIHRLQKINCV